ncbi:MAG TPA: hypothetical protein V6D28_06225 [Leptolyngbyaceae cyanobacterium]
MVKKVFIDTFGKQAAMLLVMSEIRRGNEKMKQPVPQSNTTYSKWVFSRDRQ